MATPATDLTRWHDPLPPLPTGLPILYEDEEEGEMGESNPHVDTGVISLVCMRAHLTDQPELQVYANMNLYYDRDEKHRHRQTGSLPYVSPDVMVVKPFRLLPPEVRSYTIGVDGPPPLATLEALSQRSAQQRDLGDKMIVYAGLRVPEYLLVDVTGQFLKQRLLLKRLQANGQYRDEQDADGGVTSKLGFRLVIDHDGRLRVINARTGIPYARPDEAQLEAEARRRAEERVRELEAELARLKAKATPPKRKKK